MKRGSRALTWLVLVGFLVALAFAVDRFLAMQASSEKSQIAIGELQQVQSLLERTPGTLSTASGDGTARMKKLVQERSAQNGIRLGYLAESDGDAGRGVREKNLTMRINEARQGQLVAFLSDLEQLGEGATVKELKLRPSETLTGVYRSAECVVSWRWLDEKPAVAGGGR